MRRAKIVCTLGPATESSEQVQALVDAGMDVARINRSHGSAEEAEVLIGRVRAAAEASGRPVAVLVDLQGPKIRLGTFVGDQRVKLDKGDEFTITTDDVLGTVKRVSTTFKGLPGEDGEEREPFPHTRAARIRKLLSDAANDRTVRIGRGDLTVPRTDIGDDTP